MSSRLLRDFLSFGVDVAAIDETHFVCYVDASVLSREYVVYSTYGGQQARSTLLQKRTLSTRVDVVYVVARAGWS